MKNRKRKERHVNDSLEAAAGRASFHLINDVIALTIQKVGEEQVEREPRDNVSWLDTLPGGRGRKEGIGSPMNRWPEATPNNQTLISHPCPIPPRKILR